MNRRVLFLNRKRIIIPYLSFLLINISCQSPTGSSENAKLTLKNKYEQKMISKGLNRPAIRLGIDSMDKLLILLHNNHSLSDIQKYFKWSDTALKRRLSDLEKYDFIKKNSAGVYFPTVMVIGLKEGNRMRDECNEIAKETADLIIQQYQFIRIQFSQIATLQNTRFDSISLFVLSDVLLDNWQIEKIENLVLGKPRTTRHGKNYYLSLQENDSHQIEAFGVYGNQVNNRDSFSVCIYGNNRFVPGAIQLINETTKEYLFKKSNPDPRYNFLVIDSHADQKLYNLAALVTADLVKIVEKYKDKLMNDYKRSKYAVEISFEEYFIWWYHIFYSRVTDILIDLGKIYKPAYGVAYIMI